MDAALGGPGNVFYFVADLAAAAAWYSARLGAEPVTQAAQLVMFDLNGARLTLHEADAFNQPGPSGTVPYWTVPHVDALVADWSKQGARAHRGPIDITRRSVEVVELDSRFATQSMKLIAQTPRTSEEFGCQRRFAESDRRFAAPQAECRRGQVHSFAVVTRVAGSLHPLEKQGGQPEIGLCRLDCQSVATRRRLEDAFGGRCSKPRHQCLERSAFLPWGRIVPEVVYQTLHRQSGTSRECQSHDQAFSQCAARFPERSCAIFDEYGAENGNAHTRIGRRDHQTSLSSGIERIAHS